MDEIGLDELIYQVKRELLAPNPARRATDPYPLFFVEKIELEIAVKATRATDGSISLKVLGVVEAGAGKTWEHERGHVVKVTLTPLLSREAIIAQAMQDERVRQWVQINSGPPFIRGEPPMAGQQE